MNSASVGFHCPNCVKEANRGSRQTRTPYGGQRVADPRITSFVLIGINVVVWLLIQVSGGRTGALVYKLMLIPDFAARPLPGGGAALAPGVGQGSWWQVVTSMFAHVEPWHIGMNMLALYFLGPMLENVLGRPRFLALYLVSGLAGSAAVMLLSDPNTPTLGASGAIFGLVGAVAIVVLKVGGQVQAVLFFVGLQLVFTFAVGGISWQGHIGGLIGGTLVGAAMVHAPRKNRAVVQWTATGLVLLVSLALIVARAASFDALPIG
jgi:membrane associated rhomboid family serine protease